MTSAADELRAAVKVLRETAAQPRHDSWVSAETLWELGFSEAASAWIALMSPDKAEPIAVWLEAEAAHLDAVDVGQPMPGHDHALAVARAIRPDHVKRGAK